MQINKPLVSVIIPTYNRPLMLKEAIKGVLDQTYQNLEIIVVNDAGKDVSNVIKSFRDTRIGYIQHEINKGLGGARNTGIRHSNGKYLAYLDDDDLFYPNHLETLISFLEDSEYKVAYTDAERLLQEKRGDGYATIARDVPWSNDFDKDMLLIGSQFWVLSVLHEKPCLDDVGLFDESLDVQEDWDMWIRMSRMFEFSHIKKVTCAFTRRYDKSSMTFDRNHDYLNSTKLIYDRYREYALPKPVIIKVQDRKLKDLAEDIPLSRRYQRFNCTVYPLQPVRQLAITQKVSVVIPVTKGEGNLKGLLERIYSQKKVQDLEVILVGSGELPKIGTEAIFIEKDCLNRADALNLGASQSNGEFIVFIAQDCLPLNDYWLYNMVSPFLEYPKLSALSSKVFSHPDDDLFTEWEVKDRVEALGFKNDSFWFMPEDADGVEWRAGEDNVKRRLTYFDSSSSCVRRDVFNNIQFSDDRPSPDIDFAIKLLERKMGIGYLISTGVYPLRRMEAKDVLRWYYRDTKAETKALKTKLTYFYSIKGIDYKTIMANIMGTYDLVRTGLSGNRDNAVKGFIDSIERYIEFPSVQIEGRVKDLCIFDNNLFILLGKLTDGLILSSKDKYDFKKNLILKDLMTNYSKFLEYIYMKQDKFEISEDDIINSIYKVFAMTVGRILAIYFLEAESLDSITPALQRMDSILMEGD